MSQIIPMRETVERIVKHLENAIKREESGERILVHKALNKPELLAIIRAIAEIRAEIAEMKARCPWQQIPGQAARLYNLHEEKPPACINGGKHDFYTLGRPLGNRGGYYTDRCKSCGILVRYDTSD